MKVPQFLGDAAPYFFINRWSVVRSIGRFCFERVCEILWGSGQNCELPWSCQKQVGTITVDSEVDSVGHVREAPRC